MIDLYLEEFKEYKHFCSGAKAYVEHFKRINAREMKRFFGLNIDRNGDYIDTEWRRSFEERCLRYGLGIRREVNLIKGDK